MSRRSLAFIAGLTLFAAPLAACGSSGSDSSDTTTPTADETTTTAAAAEPLKILVSNDDGFEAEGIDALVEGLQTLDDVEITVVAPLEQQSGTGGSETEGELATGDVTLASGYEATSVDGFPADSIRVALDEQEVEADLVITGINEGQNRGPLTELAGTVGAARAAATRGIPALATSQGFGEEFDYDVAVPLILEWVANNRDDLVAGDVPAGSNAAEVSAACSTSWPASVRSSSESRSALAR